MPTETPTKPVEDSIAKVNDDIAVGEDLEFQRRWWKFERGVWVVLSILVFLDVIGVFGRGPLSTAHRQTPDGALRVQYDWVDRFQTPSKITLPIGPQAVHNGIIRLWVSDEVVKALGNQRVSPQPVQSITGNGGVQYTFAATDKPNSVEFALQPSIVGETHFSLRLLSDDPSQPQEAFTAGVFVMP